MGLSRLTRLLAPILVTSLVYGTVAISGAAAAEAAPAAANGQAVVAQTNAGLTESAIQTYSPYVAWSGSRYVFTPPAALVRSDPAGVALVARTVAATNRSIATGVVTARAADGTVYRISVQTGVRAANGGHGGFSRTWYGFSIWIDEWATHRLEAGLAAGSGAAWAAAELLSWTGIGGLSGGAIAALLALGAGAIMVCDWNDRGVGFHVAVVFNVTVWCWPR